MALSVVGTGQPWGAGEREGGPQGRELSRLGLKPRTYGLEGFGPSDNPCSSRHSIPFPLSVKGLRLSFLSPLSPAGAAKEVRHGCVLPEPLWDPELSHSRWTTSFENEEAGRTGGT